MKLNHVTLLLALLPSLTILGQTNNCNNNAGGELTVGASCSPVTMNSTNSTDYWDSATGCGAADNDDVWAWFTATSTTTTITYTPASNRDAILTLLTGACSPTMSSLSCSNIGGNGVAETIVYSTTIGTVYRIRVQRNGSNNNMDGTICVWSPSSGGSCSTTGLQTFYTGGNQQDGHMFDVVANQDVTITCLDIHLNSGANTSPAGYNTWNVELYYRMGTHVGFEFSMAGWNLLGTATNLTSNGANVATPLPITFSQFVTAGQTISFYVKSTDNIFPGGIMYSGSGAVGGVLASDANISILRGDGIPNSMTYKATGRNFNGEVYYTTGPLPVKLVLFESECRSTNTVLRWTTKSEINNDHFVVQKSANGIDFRDIGVIQGNGNSNTTIDYEYIDDEWSNHTSYYRLKQVDFNGAYEYHKMIVSNCTSEGKGFSFYPNPAQNQITINPNNFKNGIMKIYNTIGKIVLEHQLTSNGSVIVLDELSNGVYIISVKADNYEGSQKLIINN